MFLRSLNYLTKRNYLNLKQNYSKMERKEHQAMIVELENKFIPSKIGQKKGESVWVEFVTLAAQCKAVNLGQVRLFFQRKFQSFRVFRMHLYPNLLLSI